MSTLLMRTRVLGAYRSLQRSQRALFAGDSEALVRAREHIRAEFAQHRTEGDVVQIEALLQVALDARRLLDAGVVQVAQEGETARVHLRPTTQLTRNRDVTDVIDDDLRWPHEQQQGGEVAAACATRCGGCACT